MFLDLSSVPLVVLVAVFAGTGVVILFVGISMAKRADQIADRTGMGEALTGAVFLGATTSLPGSVLSVVSAANGHTDLAIGNAVGGIAAQTAFLGIADLTHRRANLEHAAASFTNLTQGALLIVLLAIPLIAATTPPFSVAGISPATLALVAVYVFGLQQSARARSEPMWQPRDTPETEHDIPDENVERHGWRSWAAFAGLAAVAGLSGIALGESGIAISRRTGIAEGAFGTVFTALTTSLPELVTSIAAVRRGALTLAVGGIIGGNAFDVLFLAFADVAYRDGSIYAAMNDGHFFVMALSIAMTGILLMGLLRREKHGVAGIGFESAAVLALYAGAVLVVLG